jgi:predicted Rossmann fold flavoprotein
MSSNHLQVIIIGAGAAGLMAAIEAGKRGRQVLVLDHANKAGKKILMSGGGRCNFTNLDTSPKNFISHNPHFCKSALSRYTPKHFIDLVRQHSIPFHEKTLGQLFCDNKSMDILNMLLTECKTVNASIQLNTNIHKISKLADRTFNLETSHGNFQCESLVIATGGLSIPTMGASPFGYKIAEQFGIKIWPTRAGLVPFTLHVQEKEKLAELSGISVESIVKNAAQEFHENILFTHRGLSGPAILQLSSYWNPGETIEINLLPHINLLAILKQAQKEKNAQLLKTFLFDYLPKRVVETFFDATLLNQSLSNTSYKQFEKITQQLQAWKVLPNATEGYRTAEVTLGGIDCDAISSKTMEANNIPGLYFVGEVLDVTGWLGGYNFQWAWASGWAAGQVV